MDGDFVTAGASGNGHPTEAQIMLGSFWGKMAEEIRTLNQHDFKTQELPLARIKKIMKLDEDVKMISAEAPVLFAKAAEMFVSELSLRAWIHTEENKRRTLQKNDISQAVSKYDQFDFLIDIVPRDEMKPTKREEGGSGGQRASMMPDQVQYYFQLAQTHQQALQNSADTQQQQQQQTIQVQQPAPVIQQPQQQQQQTQQVQFQVSGGNTPQQTLQTIQGTQASLDGSNQILQIQNQQQQQQQQPTTQVFQQIVSSTGEIQNVPIQLSQAQLQAITLQMQGKQPGQPIVIQTNQQQQEAQQQQEQQMFQGQMFNIGGQQMYLQQDGELQEVSDS